MSIELAPDAEEYGLTLPVSVAPRHGDSLAGYLLDLDHACGFPAGTVLQCIRRTTAGLSKVTAPTALRFGRPFDLTRLQRLAHFTTLDELQRLTLEPLMRWLLGPDYTVRESPAYRVCPGCLAAGRGMPLLFTIKSIDGCVRCGRRLVKACTCADLDAAHEVSTALRPFAGQQPFFCHGLICGRGYGDLRGELLTDGERPWLTRRTQLATSLLEHAGMQNDNVQPGRLASTLHALTGRRLLVRVNTIDTVLDALDVTRTDVPEFISMLANLERDPRPRQDRARQWTTYRAASQPGRRARITCPNPECGGLAVLPQGVALLSALTSEQRCHACGTRFIGDRIDFSFDDVPGYPARCAEQNRKRVETLRGLTQSVCERYVREGRQLQVSKIFDDVGLRSYAPAWISPRAGLVSIIDSFRARQHETQLARLPRPDDPEIADDPHLLAALELFRSAVVDGPYKACGQLQVMTTLYYRWAKRIPVEGVAGLREFVGGRRSPFRHRPNCRWCASAASRRARRAA